MFPDIKKMTKFRKTDETCQHRCSIKINNIVQLFKENNVKYILRFTVFELFHVHKRLFHLTSGDLRKLERKCLLAYTFIIKNFISAVLD